MEKNYYKAYYHLERSHWWFTARLSILEGQVKKLLKDKSNPRILNIGIATGATSIMLAKYGQVTSLEYDETCCAFVREKCNLDVINGSMTALPFSDDSFDLVCAFDVVEHIEDDEKAIQEMKRVMHADGYFALTVPAFMFLWSEHDEINHHFRRYTKGNFSYLLTKAGLNIEYKSYFNSLLFLPIALVRTVSKAFGKGKEKESAQSDFEKFNTDGVLNKLLRFIFICEKPLLNSRISLPFGISLLTIGKK